MMTHTRNLIRKGFTLIELIVVIAIIVVLALVIVPVVDFLSGGKSIEMTGNLVDAYIANLRSKALTSNRSIIVVCFPKKGEDTSYPIKFRLADGASDGTKNISSGFVAFEVKQDSDFEDPTVVKPTERFVYLNNDLNFDEELDDNISLHREKVLSWASNSEHAASIADEVSDLEEVGVIPDSGSVFLFVILPDGKVEIPYDISVTQLDEDAASREADLIFTDGNQTLMIDISRYAKVTNRFYGPEAMEGSKYAPESEE